MLTPLWRQDLQAARSVPTTMEPVTFDVRGRRFVYEPNDMRLFTGDADDMRAVCDALVQPVTRRPQFALAAVRPRMLVLTLAKGCSLRCRYCFAEPDESAREVPAVMPLATAREAMLQLSPGQDMTIGFFGGEPLLAWDRLREIVGEGAQIAKRRNVRVKWTCTTNGVALDPEKAEWLAAHGFSLIVSLDGPERLHDEARPLATGGGSYAKVIAGLDAIAEQPTLARRTTLRATYDGTGVGHLVERLAHLHDVRRERGLGHVAVEPADLSEGCGGAGEPVRPTPELYEEYLDGAAWFVEARRRGEHPCWHHLTIRMQRLRSRKPAPSECGAGVGYVAVDTDGALHACHRLGESRVGHVRGGIDTQLQAPWRDNRYYARNKCAGCWLRNVCGGGCRLNSVHRCGNIREPDPLGCWLTETCTQAAAWALAELASGADASCAS